MLAQKDQAFKFILGVALGVVITFVSAWLSQVLVISVNGLDPGLPFAIAVLAAFTLILVNNERTMGVGLGLGTLLAVTAVTIFPTLSTPWPLLVG